MAIVSMNGKTIKISSGYKVGLGPLGDVIVLKKDGYKVEVTKDKENNIVVKEKENKLSVYLRGVGDIHRLIGSCIYTGENYNYVKDWIQAAYDNYTPTGYNKGSLTIPTEAELDDAMNKSQSEYEVNFSLTYVGYARVNINTYIDKTKTDSRYKLYNTDDTVKVSDWATSKSGYDLSVVVSKTENGTKTTLSTSVNFKFTAAKDIIYDIDVNYVTAPPPTPTYEKLMLQIQKNSDNTYSLISKSDSGKIDNTTTTTPNPERVGIGVSGLGSFYKRVELVESGSLFPYSGLQNWKTKSQESGVSGLANLDPGTSTEFGTECLYTNSPSSLEINSQYPEKVANFTLYFVAYFK